jgi:ubiquinone/menaquinone biosynthesis C-methylase UbiE
VESQCFEIGGRAFVMREGMPRDLSLMPAAQAQTSDVFGFKWQKRDTFDSPASLARARAWLLKRYGSIESAPWLAEHGRNPLVIDAGCGAGMSAVELLGPVVPRMRYLGIDASAAVDVARQRFAERNLPAAFMQTDIQDLPFPERSVDIVFSEGVLHHTESTEAALKSLARLLKPGGRFLFYVYRRKGPLREYSDDYIRQKLASMSPEQAWRAMESLTRLGVELGKLDAEIEVPEAVDLLQIPAGRINVQRLFYWHVAKVFYNPDLTFDEMNHINFDWYAPANAHRQSPEEVRAWCAEAGLDIEREVVEDSGITITAKKRA